MWRWDGICLPEQNRTWQRVWSARLCENRPVSLPSISHTWMLVNGDNGSCKAGSPPYCCRAAVNQTVKSLIISAGRRCATTLLHLVRWPTPVLNNLYCFNTCALGDLRPLRGKLTVYCVIVLCLVYLFTSCFILGFNSVSNCLSVWVSCWRAWKSFSNAVSICKWQINWPWFSSHWPHLVLIIQVNELG